jgi:outer membrane protein, multidrug efflux system
MNQVLNKRIVSLLLVGSVVGLAGCASVQRQTVVESVKPAPQWYNALPHGGRVESLSKWWDQLSDPLLVRLMMATQTESPTIAAAASRMANAYAARVQAGSVQAPQFDVTASGNRSVSTPGFSTQPVAVGQVGVQMAWELDVFGARQAGKQAAQMELETAIADWHDARTLVAAEVALTYLNYRFCSAQLAHSEKELASREESARLAQLSARAGLMPEANAALVQSAAADTANRIHNERRECEGMVKAMVVLGAIEEPELRRELAANQAHADKLLADTSWLDALFNIEHIPGQVLTQRPDIFMAQNDVMGAAYDLDATQAARWPRLSLAGFVGRGRSRVNGATTDIEVWTAGPLALSLPLIDWGTRSARVDAAKARYDQMALQYRAKVRQAVREVEDALLHLHTSAARVQSAQTAAQGYRLSLTATQAKYQAGLSSLSELEEARRLHIVGDRNLLASKRDRVFAWVELYRAAGGGWSPEAVTQTLSQK